MECTTIKFSERFDQQIRNAPDEIPEAFFAMLELFLYDPRHPALRNHPLTGKYAGFRSIDVTGDYRALFRQEGNRIIFVDIGTHDQLYG